MSSLEVIVWLIRKYGVGEAPRIHAVKHLKARCTPVAPHLEEKEA